MDYGLSGVNKNRSIPPVTTRVFLLCQFLGEKQKQRKGETGKRWKRNEKRSTEREREKKKGERKRRRKVEEECKEGSGVARNPQAL